MSGFHTIFDCTAVHVFWSFNILEKKKKHTLSFSEMKNHHYPLVYVYMCFSLLVIQVLFLPCGGRNRTIWVHYDLGTADDHGHQQ